LYRHIGEAWQKVLSEKTNNISERAIAWRHGRTLERVEHPTRLDKARMLGYRAKQGFFVVRIRLGRGGMRQRRPKSGRRPKHLGVVKIKGQFGSQSVAERRVSERYPNADVLGSYYLYEDGKYIWYEVILVDRNHPALVKDYELKRRVGILS
jgi:large subunit ribosomal protein L15e